MMIMICSRRESNVNTRSEYHEVEIIVREHADGVDLKQYASL